MKKAIISTLLLLVILFGCKQSTTVEKNAANIEEAERPLEAELAKKKAGFEEKASAEKKKIYAEGIDAVVNSKITETALQLGDTAIDFMLTNASGKEISLYTQLQSGPVILMWYRGGWCPYCNLTLHSMQQYLPDFKKTGANLIALTPELPDKSLSTKEKNSLQFEILSDVDNKTAKQYGIVFKLTNDVAQSYQNSFDLIGYNGNANNELPLAATYIIGQDKIIKYAFLNADYRNRAEPADILEALATTKQ